MPPASPDRCIVCHGSPVTLLVETDAVPYWRCGRCETTFMDSACRLDRAAELRHYRLHDNRPEDPSYRRFLEKLASPLAAKLAWGSEGLEFGCGPGPALARMLEERGLYVQLYDPFFFPQANALNQHYDFVTCTEVVEHLHDPHATFRLFDRLLKPGGWLGVMTCFQTDDSAFARWHYRRDPTHVVFYRETTMTWLATAYGWQLEIPVKDVALFRKPPLQALADGDLGAADRGPPVNT